MRVLHARQGRALLGAFMSVLLISGCSDATPETEQQTKGDIPAAPEPTIPGTRAGPLGQADLPEATALGKGWTYRIDPGSVEDGYSGSGAPAIERDPAEVVAAISPLGCRPAELPEPEHALEVTYRNQETPGVGLLLEFSDSETARSFFMEHTAAIKQCATRGKVIKDITLDETDRFVSVRRDGVGDSATWTEGINYQGQRVLLVSIAESNGTSTLLGVLN